MWYAAGETHEPDVLAYATSIDGIHWVKYKDNPIFSPNYKKYTLDNYKIGGCDVHKISNNEYIMFYIGYTDLYTGRIFVAKSSDGITNWKRYGNNPIVIPTRSSFDADACYKPSAIYDEENNKWMLWYNGRNGTDEYIGMVSYKGKNIFKNLKR